MKKNIAMRVAAFLFILTMISTCAFATTFAKYTTSKSADDTARVAKFGVVINATGDKAMFKDVYSNGTKDTVDANGTYKVVAPGTNVENAVTFTVTGTPEVAVKLTYTVDLTLTGWEIDYKDGTTVVNGEEYCPLVFTVSIGTTEKTYRIGNETGEYADIAALETALETDINKLTQEYGPNHDLSSANDVTISWEWEFNETDGDDDYQSDVKDTALGDNAAHGSAATVKLELSCTVEQID